MRLINLAHGCIWHDKVLRVTEFWLVGHWVIHLVIVRLLQFDLLNQVLIIVWNVLHILIYRSCLKILKKQVLRLLMTQCNGKLVQFLLLLRLHITILLILFCIFYVVYLLIFYIEYNIFDSCRVLGCQHGLWCCRFHCSWSNHWCLTSKLYSLDLIRILILTDNIDSSPCSYWIELWHLISFGDQVHIWGCLSHWWHSSLHLLLLESCHQLIWLMHVKTLLWQDLLVYFAPVIRPVTRNTLIWNFVWICLTSLSFQFNLWLLLVKTIFNFLISKLRIIIRRTESTTSST